MISIPNGSAFLRDLSAINRKPHLEDIDSMMSSLELFQTLKNNLSQQIIGQEKLVERLLIALLADGHLLVEGAPGLAKTRAINELSKLIEGDFQRIQFTPDLLPADLTGTEVYRPEDGTFKFQPGPLFHNLVLADEINRAPAKVQSALLEAMSEQQISVGHKTYPMDSLFLVMATQNPIEQEGTYPLPEAQLDRFLMHVKVGYPDVAAELDILRLVRNEASQVSSSSTEKSTTVRVPKAAILAARQDVLKLHMADSVEEYLVRIVTSTRHPGASFGPAGDELERWIAFGASPRATLALDRCARAHAWLAGRDYVSPQDVQAIAHEVLRHRVLMTFEAEAEGISSDELVTRLLQLVTVP